MGLLPVADVERLVRSSVPKDLLVRARPWRRGWRDVRRMAATLGAMAITSILPPAVDRWMTVVIHWLYVRLRPARVAFVMGRAQEVLDAPTSPLETTRARAIAEGFCLMRIEVRWLRARGAGLWPGRPRTLVNGFEHVEQARAEGRGVVLWRTSTTAATPVNFVFAERGQKLIHLSSERHMLGRAPLLSMRWWGALNTRDEARWLAERVVIPADGSLGYLVQLRRALEGGAMVSIVGDLTAGRTTVDHRIGTMTLSIPTGAPSLAHATGAALLPCVALRTGPLSYTIEIHGDVALSEATDRRAFRSAAVAEFGRHLEDLAENHPESWNLWGRRD